MWVQCSPVRSGAKTNHPKRNIIVPFRVVIFFGVFCAIRAKATIDRMKKGGGISTMKIDDFCRILHCEVSDIIQYIEDE